MIESMAMLILNTIALIAILVARSELAKALREIDKLSSSRASLRAEAADARSVSFSFSQPSTASLCSEPSAGGMPCSSPLRTESSPIASSLANNLGSTGISSFGS